MLLDGRVVMLFSLPVVCCLLGTCLGCVLVTGLMSDDLFLLVRTKYGLSLSYRNQGTYAVVHKYIPHHPHFVHAARHIDSMMDTDNSSSTHPPRRGGLSFCTATEFWAVAYKRFLDYH